MQAILIGGVDCTKNSGVLCDCFVVMWDPTKTQMKNGLRKLFGFQEQTIDVSEQAVFALNYSGLRDEKGKKLTIKKPLTFTQRWSGDFFSL